MCFRRSVGLWSGAVLLAGSMLLVLLYIAAAIYDPEEVPVQAGFVVDASFVAAEPSQGSAVASQGGKTNEALPSGDMLQDLLASADPAMGALVVKKCIACHTLESGAPHRVGPNLWGIVGRPRASSEGFRYSDAMSEHHDVWNEDRLYAFLHAPQSYVPGTIMSFSGLRSQKDLLSVIAYLRSLRE